MLVRTSSFRLQHCRLLTLLWNQSHVNLTCSSDIFHVLFECLPILFLEYECLETSSKAFCETNESFTSCGMVITFIQLCSYNSRFLTKQFVNQARMQEVYYSMAI